MKLVEITDRTAWDEFVSASAWGHPLQLWGWGESKRMNDWTPHRLAWVDGEQWRGTAQVLTLPIPGLGRVMAYVPRGPVVDSGSQVAQEFLRVLADWATENKALYLRIEPAWSAGAPGKGWVKSRHHVQLPETYTIDLRQSEEALLEPMSHKHRQYIRKSERDGVSVERAGDDLSAMYALYTETAQRAGFGIHGANYYAGLHRELGEHSYLYYAKFEGKPVAFLWLAASGKTAYELYGGVNAVGAEVKANYFLKWRAITEMKAAGYEIYDFNGRLNEGVSRFKDGFGPATTDYIGTWDWPVNQAMYRTWEQLWPVAKVVGRRLKRHGGSN